MPDIKKRLVLAAGGTGGHIWPAVSFGEWIKRERPDCAVKYICGSRALELEIYKAAGIEPEVLPVEGSPFSGGGLTKKGSRFASLFTSYVKASDAIKRFRPDAALSFGGYLSFPVIAACKRRGVRCAAHEQNARAGRATRFAVKAGLDVFTGWNECEPLARKKYLRTGVPIREFRLISQREAWKKLALFCGKDIIKEKPEGKTVVVFTGSLGSRSVTENIKKIAGIDDFRSWNFILPATAKSVEKYGKNVWLCPRIWDAAVVYSIADMLVLRAGGSTLTEAAATGVPSLVIPWSGAADNHQYYNALSFVSENAGLILNDGESAENFAAALKRLEATKRGAPRCAARSICENLWSALWRD